MPQNIELLRTRMSHTQAFPIAWEPQLYIIYRVLINLRLYSLDLLYESHFIYPELLMFPFYKDPFLGTNFNKFWKKFDSLPWFLDPKYKKLVTCEGKTLRISPGAPRKLLISHFTRSHSTSKISNMHYLEYTSTIHRYTSNRIHHAHHKSNMTGDTT